MADVVLFHHVQGLTDGVLAFAAGLREGGHTVTTPDFYGGATFTDMQEGFAHKKSIGDDAIAEMRDRALTDLPAELVYAGISLGVPIAQELAQTRPGARGALLYEACIPITGEWAFGPWPSGVPVQVHGMENDEFFGLEGDLDAARELVSTIGSDLGEVFVYPGDQHLFIDSSLPSYDAEASALALERSLAFLDRLG
ncbi:MAG: dienelactone hydrolase family protein [Nocardioides sp.]